MNDGTHAMLASARTDCTPPALQAVTIDVRVAGPLLDVTAEQSYRNEGREDIEVVYTFPLPPRAVLTAMDFELGERRLVGAVKRKARAERDYEQAIASGDAAVLVEQERDGRFTANLGNLKPGESARIRLRYGQLLEAAGQYWRLAIPTVLAPLYGDPHADGGLAEHKAPRHSPFVAYPLRLTVTVVGRARAEDLYSPSHAIDVVETPAGVRVQTRPGVCLDRDFVLLIRRAADALAVAGSDAEGMVAIASAVVPSRPQAQASVSMRIVLDCSGSMAGERIDWASVACGRLVAGLDAADEFSITRFGSTHKHLRPRLVPAEEANKRAARDWLLDVAADLGGTEMQAALAAAAALPGTASQSDAVLITDGEIWASDALVRWARGAGLRIHVIGVGATPNAAFLQELARETGGRSEFVTPGEDLLGAVERVLAAARAAHAPKLTVQWPRPPRWQLQWPAVAAAGDTVHCFAGFDGAVADATVSIACDGFEAHVPLARIEGELPGRVAALERIRSGHFDDPAAAAERYQLVTEWTSLIAVAVRHTADKAGGLPALSTVPQMIPVGWGGYGRVEPALGDDHAALHLCLSRSAAFGTRASLDVADGDGEIPQRDRGSVSGGAWLRIFRRWSAQGSPDAAQQRIAWTVRRGWLDGTLSRLNRRAIAARVLGVTGPWSVAALRAAGVPEALLERIARLLRKGVEEALACCTLITLLARRFDVDAESVRAARQWLAAYGERNETARSAASRCEALVAWSIDAYLRKVC
jgi:Ca-activated chloride channel family protein